MAIAKPLFDTMKNGYNRYQVDDYLSELENQQAMLNQKVEMYQQRCEDVEKQLSNVIQRYQFIVEGLDAKERAADEMARIAMKEANMIVDTAHHNADVIVKEALMSARAILMDVAKLGSETSELKGNMKEQLQELTNMLDEFETVPIPDLDLLKTHKEIQ